MSAADVDRYPARVCEPSLRERLRSRTREAQDRVDRAFRRFDLSTREGITAFLTIHARVTPPLEAALEEAGVADLLQDWPERRRSLALAADLADLGAPWPAESAPVAALRDDAEALGALYVLESARLGGASLARRAAAADDPAMQAAIRYLAHGQGVGLWPRFVARLNGHPEALARPDRVEAAALGAFAAFEYALDEAS